MVSSCTIVVNERRWQRRFELSFKDGVLMHIVTRRMVWIDTDEKNVKMIMFPVHSYWGNHKLAFQVLSGEVG